MARIRSVHPGFFTDEDIVSVSMTARICIIGLGIESDDKGVFEWKPLVLKMRLFPADNIDMDVILAELESADLVRKYSVDGKIYGAIRNFRKHQRPKTPNDIHPAPNKIRSYLCLPPAISETGGGNVEQIPQKAENPPQMEDGGGRVEDGGGDSQSKPIGINSNSGDGACGKSVSRAFDIDLYLRDPDIARFQKDFNGYDRHHLMREFNHWIATKDPPDKPVAAFFGFCRKHTAGKPAVRTAH